MSTIVQVEQEAGHVFVINTASPVCLILWNELQEDKVRLGFQAGPESSHTTYGQARAMLSSAVTQHPFTSDIFINKPSIYCICYANIWLDHTSHFHVCFWPMDAWKLCSYYICPWLLMVASHTCIQHWRSISPGDRRCIAASTDTSSGVKQVWKIRNFLQTVLKF